MRKPQIQTTIAWSFLVLAACLSAGCGWFSKNDPTESRDLFFKQLTEKKTKEAYDNSAFAFQAEQSLDEFEVTVQEMKLSDYKSINWNRKVIQPNEAKFDGEIIWNEGGRVLVAVTLIKESGQWKIYSLHTSNGGGSDSVPMENRFSLVGREAGFNKVFKQSLPSDEAIRRLVVQTMANFNTAIQQKNFNEFYKTISFAWQSQVSLVRLERAFKGFIDLGIDVGGAKESDLVFDQPPIVNNEGFLVVNGYYAIKSYHVVFSLIYTYELPKWKLYGIDVNCLKKD